MSIIRQQPCEACPYRQDVPSGVWSAEEYAKLPPYDAPTGEQPFAPFMCHATPEHYCHGWAVVHNGRGRDRELLALRLCGQGDVTVEPKVPLFSSGAEAAAHGMRDITQPTRSAVAMQVRLLGKHPRLRKR